MRFPSFNYLQDFYKVIIIFVFVLLPTINSLAQDKPLTLADITTGLQSKSSKMTLSEKNEKIKGWVEESGITFDITEDLKRELRSAGANSALITAINSAKVYKPGATINKVWTENNHTKDGKTGVLIHINFQIDNRKSEYSHATAWIYLGEEKLTQESSYFTPTYRQSLYKDLEIFVPYSDINVEKKVKHTLRLSVGIHTGNHESLAQWSGDYVICFNCS